MANGQLGADKSADLIVKLPTGTSYVIDVSIVNSSALSCIERNALQIQQDGAAIGREDLKRALYSKIETENGQLLFHLA